VANGNVRDLVRVQADAAAAGHAAHQPAAPGVALQIERPAGGIADLDVLQRHADDVGHGHAANGVGHDDVLEHDVGRPGLEHERHGARNVPTRPMTLPPASRLVLPTIATGFVATPESCAVKVVPFVQA
jgi:hypothetical protein